MDDTSKSLDESQASQAMTDRKTGQENRYLKGVVAQLRERLGTQEKSALACSGQLRLLREANQHLVLASFSASDMQATAELVNVRQTHFLSMLAHELRNPIACISSANSVMRSMDTGGPKLEKLIDIVGRQSVQMVRLVDDLLDVSRLRTGKLTLKLYDGSLAEVLESAIASAQKGIKKRLQTVRLSVPTAGIRLMADQVRLVQLFSNLLDNASKFSPPSSTLHIAAAIRGKLVAVTIRDEGKGIAPEDIGRMFDLFEQGPDETADARLGGLGIGLSLVRSIAVLHGGSVSVASAGVGLGAEFTVSLPLEPCPWLPTEGRALETAQRVL